MLQGLSQETHGCILCLLHPILHYLLYHKIIISTISAGYIEIFPGLCHILMSCICIKIIISTIMSLQYDKFDECFISSCVNNRLYTEEDNCEFIKHVCVHFIIHQANLALMNIEMSSLQVVSM